jgi:hypothetical protein
MEEKSTTLDGGSVTEGYQVCPQTYITHRVPIRRCPGRGRSYRFIARQFKLICENESLA